MDRCGAACAASITTSASCSRAKRTSISIGTTVPIELETSVVVTSFTLPSRPIVSSSSSISSPSAFTGIALNVAPVRLATSCQGTKFEWCSSSLDTTRSPGPRLSSPQA